MINFLKFTLNGKIHKKFVEFSSDSLVRNFVGVNNETIIQFIDTKGVFGLSLFLLKLKTL